MKEMVGGCCVCSDERGWAENPLVYCDGQGCNVAVHQACYGIVQVPTGPWFCRKCESQERCARVRCELCPSRDGALKRTDNGGWAHVVCALYIPEVRFGNVTTMEPIVLQLVPQDRFSKTCFICEQQQNDGKASIGACMQCNKSGCKQYFHVTCAQAAGLLCEEAGNYMDNVKYCGYCPYHYQKLKRDSNIKIIPAFKPIPADCDSQGSSPEVKRPSAKARMRADRRTSKSAAVVTTNGTTSDDPESKNGTEGNGSGSPGVSASAPPLPGKFTTANFTETVVAPAGSPVFASAERQRKRGRGPNSALAKGPKTEPASPPLTPTSTTPNSNPTPTFSSMYENLMGKEAKESSKAGRAQNQCGDRPLPAHERRPKGKKASSSGTSNFNRTLTSDVVDHTYYRELVLGTDEGSQRGETTDSASQAMQLDQNSGEGSNQQPWTPVISSTSSHVLPPKTTVIRQSALSATSGPLVVETNNSTPPFPQTLEQLLERQWEQGSSFLMKQAQHFDIASLLSCLHQLRAENQELESRINGLVARRDHLLAVNARLVAPLRPCFSSSSHDQHSPASSAEHHAPTVVENGVIARHRTSSPMVSLEKPVFHAGSPSSSQSPLGIASMQNARTSQGLSSFLSLPGNGCGPEQDEAQPHGAGSEHRSDSSSSPAAMLNGVACLPYEFHENNRIASNGLPQQSLTPATTNFYDVAHHSTKQTTNTTPSSAQPLTNQCGSPGSGQNKSQQGSSSKR